MISGLSLATQRAHIARAALESIAFQCRQVLDRMQTESELAMDDLRVDGGVTRSPFLAQFLADILNRPVKVLEDVHLTAQGAAYLGGLATGFWSSTEELESLPEKSHMITPSMAEGENDQLYEAWLESEKKVLSKGLAKAAPI